MCGFGTQKRRKGLKLGEYGLNWDGGGARARLGVRDGLCCGATICSGLVGVKVQGITELSATPTGSPPAAGVPVGSEKGVRSSDAEGVVGVRALGFHRAGW